MSEELKMGFESLAGVAEKAAPMKEAAYAARDRLAALRDAATDEDLKKNYMEAMFCLIRFIDAIDDMLEVTQK